METLTQNRETAKASPATERAAWTDDPRVDLGQMAKPYTAADVAWAAESFGESSEQDVFDEWLSGLPDVDFVDMTRAIDTIRRIMRTAWAPLPMPVLASWIDLL